MHAMESTIDHFYSVLKGSVQSNWNLMKAIAVMTLFLLHRYTNHSKCWIKTRISRVQGLYWSGCHGLLITMKYCPLTIDLQWKRKWNLKMDCISQQSLLSEHDIMFEHRTINEKVPGGRYRFSRHIPFLHICRNLPKSVKFSFSRGGREGVFCATFSNVGPSA